MEKNADSIADELADFLTSEILTEGTPLSKDSVLKELGIDSFSLMEVVLFAERRYGIDLPLEMLTPGNIRTVKSLSVCFATVLARSKPVENS